MSSQTYNLKLIFSAIDKVSAPVFRIGRAINKVSKESGFDRVAQKAGIVAKRFESVFKAGAQLGFGASAVVGGMLAVVKSSANAGDQLAKTADKLGFGIEALQEYRYAAGLAGVEQGTFDTAMQRFTRRAAEAAAGTGVARDALMALGIKLKDSAGNMRAPSVLLDEVADKMASIEDPAKRVRLAFTLFDSEGVSLVNMLSKGSGAMAAARAEARKLGIMTEEQARASERFNDNWARVSNVLMHTKNLIANELMPHFDKLIVGFKEMALEARPQIVAGFRKGMERAAEVLPSVLKAVLAIGAAIGGFTAWASGAIEATVGWEGATAAVAALLAGRLIVSIGQTVTGLIELGHEIVNSALKMSAWAADHLPGFIAGLKVVASNIALAASKVWAFSAALLANPVTLVIAGIAALAGMAYVLYQNWDGVASYFTKLWEEVKAAFEVSVIDGIMKLIANFYPGKLIIDGVNALIEYLFGVDLIAIGSRWADALGEGFAASWNNFLSWLDQAMERLIHWMPDRVKDFFGMEELQMAGPARAPAVPSAFPGGGSPGGRVNVGGEMKIRFENAPGNMRVESVRTVNPDIDLGVETGFAMGQS